MGTEKRGSGFFSGFILGSIVGVVVGFVLSRKSGEETVRGKLSDLVVQGREAIRDAIEEGKEAAQKRESEIQGTEPE